jgi:chemotaxis-related protein WspD
MKNPLAEGGIFDCWNHIGVFGDRSCRELANVIHCKNCDVYTTVGQELLNREAPLEYLNEWREKLSKPKIEKETEAISVAIFRLFSGFFAMETKYFHEVTEPVTIHRVPHRRESVLQGIVNVRGDIQLCVSIAGLLGIENVHEKTPAQNSFTMLAVIEKHGERWAFLTDEVCGIYRVDPAQFSEAANLSRVIKKTFVWEGKEVLYIDTDLLFENLSKEVK